MRSLFLHRPVSKIPQLRVDLVAARSPSSSSSNHEQYCQSHPHVCKMESAINTHVSRKQTRKKVSEEIEMAWATYLVSGPKSSIDVVFLSHSFDSTGFPILYGQAFNLRTTPLILFDEVLEIAIASIGGRPNGWHEVSFQLIW